MGSEGGESSDSCPLVVCVCAIAVAVAFAMIGGHATMTRFLCCLIFVLWGYQL